VRVFSQVVLIAVLVCFIFSPFRRCHAFEDGDLQFWNTEGVEVKLSDRCKCSVNEELRFGNNISELYHTHTDGGLTLKVTDELDLGMRYRLIYEKDRGAWKEENRPYANATVKWVLFGCKFRDRGQLEFRIPEGKDEKWRYRNKLTVILPWEWTRFSVQPYVADEVFVDFHGEKMNRNRLYGGFTAKPFKHLKTELYYLWQISKSKRSWTGINVIGLKLTMVF